MATQQDGGGVPFAISHHMQHFRLLELPPDLAALLDKPNPPLLSIKSQAPSAASTAYAVLCTPNKTFQLRQVATSNSLFVTQPTLDANATTDIPAPTTCAIASCTTTLELHPSDASAATLLEQILPVYDVVDGEMVTSGTSRSKASILDDLPLSDAQCGDGWKHLVAFELDGSSYRPSANALSLVWKSINATALAEGVKLDSQFITADLANAVAEEGHPPSFVEAIINHLAADDQDATDAWSCLDRSKTVAFVGKTLLNAKPAESDYLIADFTDTWEDCLPEIWRKDAQLTAIEGAYDFPTTTSIRSKNKSGAAVAGGSSAAKTTPASRKWHEKFGKTRKK